jgi:hypothetical protein
MRDKRTWIIYEINQDVEFSNLFGPLHARRPVPRHTLHTPGAGPECRNSFESRQSLC